MGQRRNNNIKYKIFELIITKNVTEKSWCISKNELTMDFLSVIDKFYN